MAFVQPHDRVLEHSTSNSQTVFAVTGAVNTSYNAFSASMSIGDTTIGAVVEPGVAFKSGVLTYSASNQVTVSTVFESKGTFSASGTKQVFMALPAAAAALVDAANTFTATQTITPPANTLTQALNISQSGPVSGTTAGPWNYNLITVTETANGFSGSGRDAFDLLTGDASAFRVNYTYSGTSSPPRLAGTFAVNYTGTGGTAQPVALIGSVYSNAAPSSMWGVIAFGSLGPLGSTTFLFPLVSEVSAQTGSTVAVRAGLALYTEAPVQGGTLDAAIMLTGLDVGRGTPGGFKNLISVSAATGGSAPLDTAANFFSADTAATVGSFANLPNLTFTGDYLNFQNFRAGADGRASFGSATLPDVGIWATVASGGATNIFGSTNSTSGFDGVTSNTASSGNITFMGVAEAANTAVRFGQTIGNWGLIRALGASNLGLAIGTDGAMPLILGTNNTARMTIDGTGLVEISAGLSINTASSPGTGLIYINSASFLMRNKTSWSTGAGVGAGTLTNAPSAGNPTKWIPVDDNGTTRYLPAW